MTKNGDKLPELTEQMIETTTGRVIFNRILPMDVQFVNEELDKGGVKEPDCQDL
jgi:DNA-directed RNA polymerase beta' subunit